MGERKPQNKHYPPDFDPSKIPRRRQPKNGQITVRTMLPMSIRCLTCGAFISKGTKFNSRKEGCAGEAYLGIQILRFYVRCNSCSAEITFKTDPKNSDYAVESGASRNFEPWREEDGSEKRRREAEEVGDAMRALENRASDSKRDMDGLAALEELRCMKARHEVLKLSSADHLKEEETVAAEQLDEEDEELVKSIFRNSRDHVKRIDDDDEDFGVLPGPSNVRAKTINGSSESALNPTDVLTKTNGPPESSNRQGNKAVASSKMPKFIVKKPKPAAENSHKRRRTESATTAMNEGDASEEKTDVFQSLCQYDSDE